MRGCTRRGGEREAPEVGGDELDVSARIEQEPLGWTEESTAQLHASPGEEWEQVDQARAVHDERLEVVAVAEGMQERAGLPRPEWDTELVACVDPRDGLPRRQHLRLRHRLCLSSRILASERIGAIEPRLTGVVDLPGGTLLMGCDNAWAYPGDGESPIHEVDVAPFRIGATTVTNDQFAAFVDITGHTTEAERFGWSFVFAGLLPDDHPDTHGVAQAEWWRQVEGATWNRPEGPSSDLDGRGDHPVAVSYTHLTLPTTPYV